MTLKTLFFIIYCALPFIQILGFFLLLFVKVPDMSELKNYAQARKGMALAYLLVGLCGAAVILFGDEGVPDDLFSLSIAWLIISSPESLLLTYGVVLIIDINTFSKRALYLQGGLIAFFVLLAVCSLIPENPLFRKLLFPFFLFFYVCQLVYYTRLFMQKYNQYVHNAENYFSGNEASRLHWLKVSFFSLLSIGLIALLPILYVNHIVEWVLSGIYAVFYAYILFKYLNYPYTFYDLRPVLEFESEGREEPEEFRSQLTQKLEKWIEEKKYCQVGVTISSLANDLGVGRNSLSNYINNNEKMNFNAWINRLRVNEAKIYLSEQPDMSISDMAYKLGYSDISTFSRQFKMIEGVSPLKWRSQSLNA